MSTGTAAFVIFIVVLSALFPLGGYYLDHLHNKKMQGKDKHSKG